jgi:hypothetical protein
MTGADRSQEWLDMIISGIWKKLEIDLSEAAQLAILAQGLAPQRGSQWYKPSSMTESGRKWKWTGSFRKSCCGRLLGSDIPAVTASAGLLIPSSFNKDAKIGLDCSVRDFTFDQCEALGNPHPPAGFHILHQLQLSGVQIPKCNLTRYPLESIKSECRTGGTGFPLWISQLKLPALIEDFLRAAANLVDESPEKTDMSNVGIPRK